MKNYTAYMGTDNCRIGRMLGDYAASLLGGQGEVVEIAGEHGSSPAIERHNGFADALKAHPGIRTVGYEEGNWKREVGRGRHGKGFTPQQKENPDFTISLVFGGNDRMAVGARAAIERYRSTHPQSALAQPASPSSISASTPSQRPVAA